MKEISNRNWPDRKQIQELKEKFIAFHKEHSPIKITENTQDITRCFHPNYHMNHYMLKETDWDEKIKNNANAFKPSFDINKLGGGIIVFTNGQNIPPNLLLNRAQEYNKDYHYNIGNAFLGQYNPFDDITFNPNSLTLEITGITPQNLIKFAEDIAASLLQENLIIKSYNDSKIYLTKSRLMISDDTNFYAIIYQNMAEAGLVDKDGYAPYMKTDNIKFPTQFNHYTREAKKEYVRDYLSKNTIRPKNEDEQKNQIEKLAKTALENALKNKMAIIYPPLILPIKSGFGFAVGKFRGTLQKQELTYDILFKFISDYISYLTLKNSMLTVWYDTASQQWNLDFTEIIFNEKKAQILSKIRNKNSYYCLDLALFKTLDAVQYGK